MKGEKSNKVLLLFVIHHLGKIEGRTRLQKLVYLLKNLYNIGFTYDFQYYLYGPYSTELQSDINALCSLGVVKENKVFANNIIKYIYETTAECERIVKKYSEPSNLKEALMHLNQFSTEKLIALAKMLIAKETHNIQIDYKP